MGDVAELNGIKATFGDHVYKMNINATKSMTGHLLGAAGAIEALACILALTKGIVAPTINNENLDPQIDPKLNLTLNKAQQRDVKCAIEQYVRFRRTQLHGDPQKNLSALWRVRYCLL